MPPRRLNQNTNKLLVVDDSSLVIDLIRFALRKMPIEIIGDTRADTALRQLEEENVALIITDLKMPGIGGLEFLYRLRKIPAHKDTPVLVISGYEDKSYVKAAYEAGATAFIPKPFTSEEVYDVVMREIQREKKAQAIRAQTAQQAAINAANNGQPS